jgi:hypothetical protein
MRCSSAVCSFERVWGAFYRQGRSVERVGPFSQVLPDEEVRLAQWPTASHFGRPWSLLLRRLTVGALCRFRPVWWLGGASGPLGVAGPPLCHGMNRLHSGTLRIALEWGLWRLFGRTSGPINPSRSNRRFLGRSRSSKLCRRERRCVGPEACHGAGAAAPARPTAPTGLAVPGGAAVPSPCGTLVPILF